MAHVLKCHTVTAGALWATNGTTLTPPAGMTVIKWISPFSAPANPPASNGGNPAEPSSGGTNASLSVVVLWGDG